MKHKNRFVDSEAGEEDEDGNEVRNSDSDSDEEETAEDRAFIDDGEQEDEYHSECSSVHESEKEVDEDDLQLIKDNKPRRVKRVLADSDDSFVEDDMDGAYADSDNDEQHPSMFEEGGVVVCASVNCCAAEDACCAAEDPCCAGDDACDTMSDAELIDSLLSENGGRLPSPVKVAGRVALFMLRRKGMMRNAVAKAHFSVPGSTWDKVGSRAVAAPAVSRVAAPAVGKAAAVGGSSALGRGGATGGTALGRGAPVGRGSNPFANMPNFTVLRTAEGMFLVGRDGSRVRMDEGGSVAHQPAVRAGGFAAVLSQSTTH